MKHLKTEIHITRHIDCPNCGIKLAVFHTENNCTSCGRSLVVSAQPISTCPFCGDFLIGHRIPSDCDREIATIELTVGQYIYENVLAQDRDGDWWHVKYDDSRVISIEYASNPAAVCNEYKTKYRGQIERLTQHANHLAGCATQFRDKGGK